MSSGIIQIAYDHLLVLVINAGYILELQVLSTNPSRITLHSQLPLPNYLQLLRI